MEYEEQIKKMAAFGNPTAEGNSLGFPTPEERVNRTTPEEHIGRAQANERALLNSRYQGLSEEAARYEDVRETRRLNPLYNIAGDSDAGRAVAGGLVRGVGTVAEGAGYLSGQVVDNPVSRSLEAIGQAVTKSGQAGLDSRSQKTQYAIEDSRIEGNLLKGEMSIGEDFSLSGLFHTVLPSIAEMAPTMAALIFSGGTAGALAAVGTGVAQAGISQGNQQFEAIMGKSEREMTQFSTAYNELRKLKPDMTHEEAKREIADTGKLNAAVVGGAIGGAGGLATAWLWRGAPLLIGKKVTAAASTGEKNLLAASVGKRAAVGFVEEGSEEVAEGVGATLAVNKAIGSNQEVGKDSASEFVIGGLTGATVNTAGAVKRAEKEARAERRAERARVRTESAAATLADNEVQANAINERIDAGEIDRVINNPTEYKADVVAASLVQRANDKDATPEQRKKADEGLAKLELKTRTSLETLTGIKEKGLDGYFAGKETELTALSKQFQDLIDSGALAENQVAMAKSIVDTAESDLKLLADAKKGQAEITDAVRDARIKELTATVQKIESASALAKQGIRDSTPDDTDQLIESTQSAETAPEQRTKDADTVIDRAITDPDLVSDEQLKTMHSSGVLTDEQEEAIQTTLNLRDQIAPGAPMSKILGNIQNRPTPADTKLGFVSMREYYQKVDRAITAGKPANAQKTLESVDRYAAHKQSKSDAMMTAYQAIMDSGNRSIQQAIIPSKDPTTKVTTWNAEIHDPTAESRNDFDKRVRAAKGLTVSTGSKPLIDQIAREAAFITQHGQLLKRQVEKGSAAISATTTQAPTGVDEKTASEDAAFAASDDEVTDALTEYLQGGTTAERPTAGTTPEVTPASTQGVSTSAPAATKAGVTKNSSVEEIQAELNREPPSDGKLRILNGWIEAKGGTPEKPAAQRVATGPGPQINRNSPIELLQAELANSSSTTKSKNLRAWITAQGGTVAAPAKRSANLEQLKALLAKGGSKERLNGIRKAIKAIEGPTDVPVVETPPPVVAPPVVETPVKTDIQLRARMGDIQKEWILFNDGNTEVAEGTYAALETEYQQLQATVKPIADAVLKDAEPGMRELFDMQSGSISGASVSDMISWVRQYGPKVGGRNVHADLLNKMVSLPSINSLGNVSLHTTVKTESGVEKKVRGSFDPTTNHVGIDPLAAMAGANPIPTMAGTIVHELVHVFTHEAITNNGELRSEIEEVQAEIKEYLAKPENAAKMKTLGATQYATLNPQELISTVLGSGAVRADLALIPSKKGGNVLSRLMASLIDTLRGKIPINPAEEAMLERVLSIADELFNQADGIVDRPYQMPDGENQGRDINSLKPAEIRRNLQTAYVDLGRIQNANNGSAETTTITYQVAIHAQREKIKLLTDRMFAGKKLAPMRELVSLINTDKGSPYKRVAKWAHANAEGEIAQLLLMMTKTNTFKEIGSVTLDDPGNSQHARSITAGYSPDTNSIFLAPIKAGSESAEATIKRAVEDTAHELVHPITQKLLDSDKEFRAEAKRLREVARTWYYAEENVDLIKGMKKSRTNPKGIDFGTFEYSIAAHKYGTDPDSPHEILATVIASDTAKAIYAQIMDDKATEQSVLQSFRAAIVAAVKRFFSDSQIETSVLEGVLGLTQVAIDADLYVDPEVKREETPAVEEPVVEEPTPTEPVVAEPETLEQEADRLRRTAAEDAVRKGEQPFYSFETDGDVEIGHVGPPTAAEAATFNMLRGHLPSKHRTPMSYSNNFMTEVFLNPDNKMESFARYLSNPVEALANFRKKGNTGQYRQALKYFHARWTTTLAKDIKPAPDAFRWTDPISFLFQDGKLDANAASAIAVGTFTYMAETGDTLWSNYTEQMVRAAAAVADDVIIPQQLANLLATAGQRETSVRLNIGKAIAQIMDITLPEGTPRNEIQLIYGALGTQGLILLEKEEMLQRNVYNGLEARPEGIALLNKLAEADQMPSAAVLAHRGKLAAHLKRTSLSPEEQAEFGRYAFATHVFIRTNREPQADVGPLFQKLAKEGIYQGERISKVAFEQLVQGSTSLDFLQKGRVVAVFREWTRPKAKGEQAMMAPENLSNLMTAAQGSRTYMDQLLGRDSNTKVPHTDAAKAGFSAKSTKNNSDIPVPKAHIKQLDKASKLASSLTQGLLSTQEGNEGIVTRLFKDNDLFLPLLQGMTPTGALIHDDDINTTRARNDGLIREAQLVYEHVYDVLDGDSLKSWYKNFTVWSNDRIGEDSQGWNSTAAKMHRALESSEDWLFDVNPGVDNLASQAFKYAVAQSLGVSVDKGDIPAAIAAFEAKLEHSGIQEAIELANKMRNDPSYTWTEDEQLRVISLIHAHVEPGDATQALRALVELAKYADGKSFSTDISAEIDGRASGATITQLQMGMESPDSGLHMLLGGLIPMGSEFENAGDSIQQTKMDIYKKVVKDAVFIMDEEEAYMLEAAHAADRRGMLEASPDQRTAKARWQYSQFLRQRRFLTEVMGSATNYDPDSPAMLLVTALARQAVKEPTTANVFGAGHRTLQSTMSDDFYALYKQRVVDYGVAYAEATTDEARQAAVSGSEQLAFLLNQLLKPVDRISILPNADYTAFIPNFHQRQAIAHAVEYTFARATSRSIGENFMHSRAVAQKLQTGLGMVQLQYKAVYEAEKRIVLNAQNEKAKADGRPLHAPNISDKGRAGQIDYQTDLTTAQHNDIIERIQNALPMIHSPSSLKELNSSKGMSVYKNGAKKVDETDPLRGDSSQNFREQKFSGLRGKSQLRNDFYPATARDVKRNHKSTSFQGQQLDAFVTGIGALAKAIHSQDAWVALMTFPNFSAINAHDGFTSGALKMFEMGQAANKAFLDVLSDYSPAEQLARTIVQSADAFNAIRGRYMDDPQFVADMYSALPTVADDTAPSGRKTLPESPAEHMYDMLRAVARAHRARLTALSNLKMVDQYVYPNSGYPVSDKQRKAFAMKASVSNLYNDIVSQRSQYAEAMPVEGFVPGEAQKTWLNNASVNADAVADIKSFMAEEQIRDQADAEQAAQDEQAQLDAEEATFDALSEQVVQEARVKSRAGAWVDKKLTMNALNNVNKQIIANPQITMISAVYNAVKSAGLREQLIGEFANPDAPVFNAVPKGKLPELRQWHADYHARGKDDSKGSMYSPGVQGQNAPLDYSTQEVFDALDKGRLSEEEATHLKGLLTGITNKLYSNSSGNSPGLTRAEMGQSVGDLADRHTIENIGPFSSNLQRAGVQLSRAQAFVAEQIEMTMQEALASQTLADNSVVKLYQLAKGKFNPDGREFYLDAQGNKASDAEWAQATDVEKAQARQAYDLVFTTKGNTGNSKSDHLSRFVAMGLVYPPIRQQLNDLQQAVVEPAADEKMGTRLSRYFDLTLQKISNASNRVNASDANAVQLHKLAKRLALNEHKRRLALNADRMKSVDFIEQMSGNLGAKISGTVVDIAGSKMIQDSQYAIVKAAGDITSTIAQDRVDEMMALLEKWRDYEKKSVRETMIRAMTSEIRGETPENVQFYDHLSWAKVVEQTRKEKRDITQQEILNQFENSDKINDVEKAAVTQLYLRSDLASLIDLGYDMEQIHSMVKDENKRKGKISQLQDRLLSVTNGKAMVIDTTEMAHEMATGRTVSELGYQNARLLVRDNDPSSRVATYDDNGNEISATWSAEALATVALVDELGSLMALDMAPRKYHVAAKALVDRESARGDQDALSYVVGLHRTVLQNARDTLFNGDAFTGIKGYVRESYDPYNTYETAGPVRGQELLDQGYELYGKLNNSSLAGYKNDPKVKVAATGNMTTNREEQPSLYVLKGQGLADYQTGAMMNNHMKARGAQDRTAFEFESTDGKFTYYSRQEAVDISSKNRRTVKANRIAQLDAKSYRPRVSQELHEMPVFNSEGRVTGYRYKATHQTRDEAMGRDNRFESVLGATVANTYTKQQSIDQNNSVVKTLKEFYDDNVVGNEDRYVEVSPTAPDERMRETYRLLPDHTKHAINQVWGGNKMLVRKDLLDVTLGYRNLTTDVVLNSAKDKIDTMLSREIVGQLLSRKQAIKVRRWHDHTAAVMRKYKSFIVVRNGTTLYNNMKSNAMLLFMYGVPLKNLIGGHRRAFQGLRDYTATQKQILRLQNGIDAALPGADTTAAELQIQELQFSLNRNPVKPLIDQGMYQTILDDVDLDRENSIYKDDSEKFVEKHLNRLPDTVVNIGSQALVAEGTWTHKMLSQGTQMSDFVARFVLYESMLADKARAPEGTGMTEKQIISEVRQAFVNYNRPTDQRLQYLNDIGLVKFTKYTLGTQKIIYNRLKKAPSRAMVAYLADRNIDNMDTILSSNMVTNIGNPLSPSVLDAPSVLDEPLWIKLGLGFL